MNCGRRETIKAKIYRHYSGEKRWSCPRFALAFVFIFSTGLLIFPVTGRAQVSYVARFTLDKQKFLLGEPIFCNFVIQNTGARTFSFRYRSPDRILNSDLENEPHFRVTTRSGRLLPDPAPKPCGGAKGSAVYGSVTLPPGQTHTERWLLNQWGRFLRPGQYKIKAERRLPLLTAEPGTPEFTTHPAAYALALDDLQIEVTPSTETEIHSVFQPYLKLLDAPAPADVAEPVLVVTTLPQTFFLDKLEWLAQAPASEHRWDRSKALEGLARLGTPAAWNDIVKIARGENAARSSSPGPATPSTRAIEQANDLLRNYAVLLLGEKADPAFLPALLEIIKSSSGDLRGEAIRALGFFHDPRAANALFEKLRSTSSTDRVNAILGLKNMGTRNSIPAILAMLQDPDAEVRQVSNFALQGLTREQIKLSPSAGRVESEHVAHLWRQWWQAHAANFVPAHPPACHDW
ncbi:MAG: HEAT repeat domain-containing protein [Terriglobia bacterium]